MSTVSNPNLRKPKYQEILDTLLQEIGSGRYREGDRLPTDDQFASRFDVSRPTITKAVHELVRMGLVRRRAGAGTFICEPAPDDGKTRQVFGLVVPELGDSEIFEPICGGIARFLQARGHLLQWAGTDLKSQYREKTHNAQSVCKQLIESKVDGVFLAPFVTPEGVPNPNKKILDDLGNAGIPVVLLDRDIVSFPERSALDLVGIDHALGQSLMTRALIKMGHQKIGFWLWENVANTVKLRLAGIQQTYYDNQLSFDRDLIRTCDPSSLRQVAEILDTDQPDAIMCANDVFAAHLMKTLELLGVRVPNDISVTGYDDVHYAHLLRVPLTTVSQPCEQIAESAARLMLERANDLMMPPRRVVLAPKLSIRESTASKTPD